MTDLGDDVKCARCGEEVYQSERLRAVNKVYHKICFKCAGCDSALSLGKEFKRDGHPFCKKCYDSNYRVGQGNRVRRKKKEEET
ncbi:LIM domain containing protein [Acanthamoeba castellanii str. Neff]|uniref:LIM domain containing protein n=1 Tax=Acanthamoeba castellanii (strain ATCC 30010 / Neff) TaxID=1257118 RepID=L8H5V5_ACACF|nr:LIM domain containing protein [Acanthamoeba castellanii str. Neff]ELR20909.1 LIM domain containing protein [Acanthamoeba castellanii str. Neff]